jgi:hypothetical protein
MGRKPIGDQAMTGAERVAAYRGRLEEKRRANWHPRELSAQARLKAWLSRATRQDVNAWLAEMGLPLQADVTNNNPVLSLSQKQKLEIAECKMRKRLELEYEQKHRAEIDHWLNQVILPAYARKLKQAENIIKSREGSIKRETYRSILSCLHPDRIEDETLKERFSKAFHTFKTLELVLCSEKELPTTPSNIPSTPAEWYKRREETRAQRKKSA